MTGPPTIGMVIFEPLTTGEYSVLLTHLTSGWYKQRVLYGGIRDALWRETSETLRDLGRHFDVAFERENVPAPGGCPSR
jgi:hypothetical protein